MHEPIRGRDKFNKYKTIIVIICRFYSLFPQKAQRILFEHYRMTKGLKGLLLRYALLKTLAVSCGSNVSIHPGVYILSPERLSIGENVSIHPMCYIDATGGMDVGSDVSIAHGVTVMSTSHSYEIIDVPIKDQVVVTEATRICDNVWIGAKATILSGIKIGMGSVVAAGAVVTKDVTTKTIVAGVPARIIKERG